MLKGPVLSVWNIVYACVHSKVVFSKNISWALNLSQNWSIKHVWNMTKLTYKLDCIIFLSGMFSFDKRINYKSWWIQEISIKMNTYWVTLLSEESGVGWVVTLLVVAEHKWLLRSRSRLLLWYDGVYIHMWCGLSQYNTDKQSDNSCGRETSIFISTEYRGKQ